MLRSTTRLLKPRSLLKCTFATASKIIVKSPIELPELQSDIVNKPLPLFLLDTFLHPERKDLVSAIDGSNSKSITYGETYYSSYSLADTLRDFGLRKGDCIAIMSPNTLYYLTALLGITLTGAAASPINPLYTEKEIAYQLDITKSKIVFAHPICAERVLGAVKSDVKVVIVDQDVSDLPALKQQYAQHKNVVYMSELYTVKPFKAKHDHNSYLWNGHEPDGVAVLPFSSGTTGRSKGVMLTHKNIIANVLQTIAVEGKYLAATKDTPRGTALCPLPFFHIYGFTVGLFVTHFVAGKLVFLPQFDLVTFLELIQKEKVTRGYVAPPILLQLAKNPLVDKYDLSSVQSLLCGGAPLGSDTQVAASKRLNCIVKQIWGMTELSPTGTLAADEAITSVEDLKGSGGPLVPGTEGKIINPVTGEDLNYDQEGELMLRGPQVMKGYLNEIEATKNTIRPDGWLHTGDIGYFDDKGWLFLKDRIKELIKYKGFQVPPADLEALILTMPEVKDVIVIPIPDEDAGEVPRAYVVKQESAPADFTEQDVIDFVYKNVAPHKRLRGGVIFAASVPKSPSGKLLRRIQIDIDKKLYPQLYSMN